MWANAEELLETVLEKRNLIGNFIIKVMADGGQGFFKICLTILPENYSAELDSGVDSDYDAAEIPTKTRKLYSEGGSTGKKIKIN